MTIQNTRFGPGGNAMAERTDFNARSTWILVLALILTTSGCGGGPEKPSTGDLPQAAHSGRPTAEHSDRAHDDNREDHRHDEQDGHGSDGHSKDGHSLIELSAEAYARADIQTVPVTRQALVGALQTTGQVDFDQSRVAHVSPRIPGRVHRVDVALGETVRQGQILASLDSVELGQAKADYLKDKAQEELHRAAFERSRALYDERIISEQQVLVARADLREAEAALLAAKETLHLYGMSPRQIQSLGYKDPGPSLLPLRAPFSGTIIERHVTLGELVTPKRNLFTVADLSRLWIWVDVYQRNLGKVHLDDEVQARVDAYPDEVFTGKVSYLSPRVDIDTRTVRARIDISNVHGKLRPGMFVQVGLFDPHGTEQAGEHLIVPADAVARDDHGPMVFVVMPDGADGTRRFERRRVTLGLSAAGKVELIEGVSEGEAVVQHGVFLLKSAASKDAMGGGHSH